MFGQNPGNVSAQQRNGYFTETVSSQPKNPARYDAYDKPTAMPMVADRMKSMSVSVNLKVPLTAAAIAARLEYECGCIIHQTSPSSMVMPRLGM